ncbi:MAG TPA: hypothetical protein VF903_09230 [Nitrospirota bacterium]
MHTDEFEISLLRELSVCKNTILRIKKSLGLLERKHNMTTAYFLEGLRTGRLVPDPEYQDDYAAWQSSHESLKTWEELERKYQEVFRMMKI